MHGGIWQKDIVVIRARDYMARDRSSLTGVEEEERRRVAVAWEAGCVRVCVEIRRAERVRVVRATLVLNFGGAMGEFLAPEHQSGGRRPGPVMNVSRSPMGAGVVRAREEPNDGVSCTLRAAQSNPSGGMDVVMAVVGIQGKRGECNRWTCSDA